MLACRVCGVCEKSSMGIDFLDFVTKIKKCGNLSPATVLKSPRVCMYIQFSKAHYLVVHAHSYLISV